jgi:hypothetical protein
MVIMKRASKELDINRRHSSALTGNERVMNKLLMEILERLQLQRDDQILLGNPAGVRRIWRMTRIRIHNLIACVTIPHYVIIEYNGERLRINSRSISDAMIAVTYRFKTRQQLRDIFTHFQIPLWFRLPSGGHKLHGEEVLLMTLERCALGTRLIDMQQKYHVYHSIIGRATHMFAKWMQDNWGYLIHDNIDFWVPYLAESCEAIKQKVDEHYNVQVDERPNSETHRLCGNSWQQNRWEANDPREVPLAHARIFLQRLGSRTRS